MSGPSLLFVHGWGFDSSFWAPLRSALGDVPGAAADLGYFGPLSVPKTAGPVLVVVHSLGAMLALREPPNGCIGMVAIGGFDRFSEAPGFPGISRRLIDRMLAKLESAPSEVVADFRRRCGADEDFGPPRPEPLADHLRLLRDGDLRPCSAAWPWPLLVLHGQCDPILPPYLRDRIFQDAPRLERYSHAEGGHLLPLSHPDWCAHHIARVLEALP